MKKILLCLFLFTSFTFYSQIADLTSSCNVYDLTRQYPVLIGNLNQNETVITYHLSFADATNGINAITEPKYYQTEDNVIIYARINSAGVISTNYFKLTDSHPMAPLVMAHSASGLGKNDGLAEIIIFEGLAPFRIELFNYTTGTRDFINTLQSPAYFFNLAPGYYRCHIEDGNHCVNDFLTFAIADSPLSFTTTAKDKTLTVIATGGISPYYYSIDNGKSDSNNVFSGLSVGTHQIQVYDSSNNSNVSTANVIITEPAVLNATTTSSNVKCHGDSNGSITITATGGNLPYTYSKDGINYAENNTFNNLTAGTHTTYAKDSNGIVVSNLSTITQPTAPLSITTAITIMTCSNSGSITITATGGQAPYSYSIDGTKFADGNAFSNLAAGTYSTYVKDANGCVASNSTLISQPVPLLTSMVITDVNCYGANDGSIITHVTGGKEPYSYTLDYGAPIFISGNIFTSHGLASGTHTVEVKDANGCTISSAATITQPAAPLAITAVSTNVNCHGASDGSITINATGGKAPYQYSIDGTQFSNSNTFSNLTSGNYATYVKDANGCTNKTATIIAEPLQLTMSATLIKSIDCISNATIAVAASGGKTPYTYAINNGAYSTSNTFSNLVAGTYTTSVKDANGCISSSNYITINPLIPLSISTEAVNVSCNGNNDGSITISTTGGKAPFYYSNDNGVTYVSSNVFSNLVPGTYNLAVKDANNCISTKTAIIVEPAVLSMTEALKPIDCVSNATVTLTALGGTPPYTYSKDGITFVQSNVFDNLVAGTYTTSVKDANGCVFSNASTITQPVAPLAITTASTNVNCHGASDGSIAIAASGGQAPYKYSINGVNFQQINSIHGLPAGAHHIRVTDANGCMASIDAILTEPSALMASSTVTNISCIGDNSGSITITATGGSGSYNYSIDGTQFSASNTFSNLAAGNYSTYVKDANGCVFSNASTITQPVAPLAITAASTNISCNGNKDGSITITASGGKAPYNYSFNGVNFQQINSIHGLASGIHHIRVTDSNGCTDSYSVTVTEPAPLTATTTVTTNQTVTATGIGGTTPYQYSLNGGAFQTSNMFSILTPGTYVVVLKDANGCSVTNAITIVPTIIVAVNDTFTTTSGSTTASVLTNDTLNGQPINLSDIIATATPIPGFTFNPNGTITVASGTATGTYLLTYTIASILSSATATGTAIITVFDPVQPPTGKTTQSLPQGATLADLVVAGENIEWYASLTGKFKRTASTPLPMSTILVDNMTYYASQTINGIRSPDRLAVKVTLKTPGTDDPIFGDFTYYPNPVKDVLTILNPSIIDEVVLSSITGQTLLTKKINSLRSEIDLSNLSNGIYLLKIKSQGQEKTVKIIKK